MTIQLPISGEIVAWVVLFIIFGGLGTLAIFRGIIFNKDFMILIGISSYLFILVMLNVKYEWIVFRR